MDKEVYYRKKKKKEKTTVTRANYSCASEYVGRQAAKRGICYNRIVKFPTGCNYLYGFCEA